MLAMELVLRWIHIFGAIILVGGVILMRCAYLPAMAENAAPKFASAFRSRWSKLVMMSSGLLLISGLINFILVVKNYEVPGQYHMVFGIKFLLVFLVFFLSAALSGRSGLAEKLRQKEQMWLTVNLVLAVVVVCLAGFMKTTERTPKVSQGPVPDVVRSASWM
jgi:putative copper export protein